MLSPLHLYTRAQPPQRPKEGERRGSRNTRRRKKARKSSELKKSGSFEGFSSFVSGRDLRSAGKMAPAKTGERASSFSMACSLLSRYVKQNGAAAGDLGLGIKAEADGQRTPSTMSLLPGAGADAGKEEARKETMELFPQNAGFRSEAATQEAPDAREQGKHQLTIFYGGMVLVFNDFPAEKVNDLMQLASKGASAVQNSGLLSSSTTATVSDSTKVAAVPAPPNVVVNAKKNPADIPQAPKASLRRFLEKRKDRLNAKAPYQGSASDATPVKKEMPESQAWLGLGPQITNPDLSLRQERNQ